MQRKQYKPELRIPGRRYNTKEQACHLEGGTTERSTEQKGSRRERREEKKTTLRAQREANFPLHEKRTKHQRQFTTHHSPLIDMQTLNETLPGKESHNTEFKSVWKDEYLKQICGFANANGGELFIGINDKGKVVGVQNTKKLLEDIPNKTVSLLGITVNVSQLSHDKLNYLVIEVMRSSVPISYRGKYFIRSGSTTQELKGHELRAFILQKDNITWDEITISKATKNDLDENVVFRFIKSAIVKIGRFGNSDTELISQDTIEGNLLEMH